MKAMKQLLSTLTCSTLLTMGVSAMAQGPIQAQNQPQQNSPQSSSEPQPAPGGVATPAVPPQTTAQLDALVAPIALYPDALVAQVLAASAYPEQIAFADDWVSQNTNLTGSTLTQAVDQQSWDESVKALTQFPSVLHNLAHNLSWTSNLGEAFTNQQADVMAAVQAMRGKAQAAGTLQSSSQITVVQQSPSTIVIQPANPNVVYVPQYDPGVVYGAPVVVPLYVPPPMPVVAAPVYFGTGITIGATFGSGGWGGGFGWGWHAWNVNWGGGWGGGGTVIYNNNTYINKTVINRTTNNTYNNGPRFGPVNHAGGATGSENHGYYSANGTYHPDPGYRPGVDTHYGPNGGYHPNGYFGPNGGFHPDKPGTNPGSQPNGGDNGNHGLIGGNGGEQQGFVNHAGGATGSENRGYYSSNGTYHPNADYHPGADTHYGPNGAYHPDGYYGPHGGFHTDKPGTNPGSQPNGGNNGNHGLIGGNGGVQQGASQEGGQRMLGSSDRQSDNSETRMDRPRANEGRNGRAPHEVDHAGRRNVSRQPHPQHMRAPHNSGNRGRRG